MLKKLVERSITRAITCTIFNFDAGLWCFIKQSLFAVEVAADTIHTNLSAVVIRL
jgi:hypothetical protein